MVSAGAQSADRAMSLVPYLLITQLVLCGVLFNLHGMSFISWFMPARWSVSGLGGIAGLAAASAAGLNPAWAAFAGAAVLAVRALQPLESLVGVISGAIKASDVPSHALAPFLFGKRNGAVSLTTPPQCV